MVPTLDVSGGVGVAGHLAGHLLLLLRLDLRLGRALRELMRQDLRRPGELVLHLRLLLLLLRIVNCVEKEERSVFAPEMRTRG